MNFLTTQLSYFARTNFHFKNCVKPVNLVIRSSGNFKRPTSHFFQRGGDHKISLENYLDSNKIPSISDWKSLRHNIIENERHITDMNVDSLILGQYTTSGQIDKAKSYINFMKSEEIEPNYGVLGNMMKAYYMSFQQGILGDNEKVYILNIYERLRQKHSVLDPTTCENLICGLATTDQWRKSLELLDMIKLTCKPNANVYSILISKAFQTQENNILGWKLLHEMVENNKQPKSEIFLEYFKNLGSDHKSHKLDLERMFQFVGDNNILVSRAVIENLCDTLRKNKIKSKIARVSYRGVCSHCKLHMKNVALSSQEFESLRSSFLESVLIRNDVFQKSTPEEVNKFTKFLDDTGAYDCVVDGLNVAFSTGVNRHPSVYAKHLTAVVKYLVEKRKRILILGRQHMTKWPKDSMSYVYRNARFFLTSDLSSDDPFLLYAALKSGPGTDFFSRDLMRSHAHLLGSTLKPIFRRWQQEHQYSLVTATDRGKAIIKDPIKHFLSAHKVESTWHIPFKEEYSPNPAETYDIPFNWLCITL